MKMTMTCLMAVLFLSANVHGDGGDKGGNGGSSEEIALHSHLNLMKTIILSPAGQKLFSDLSFDRRSFKSTVSSIRISVTADTEKLKDRWGTARDCINRQGEFNVVCRAGILKQYQKQLQVIYAKLFHETLNVMGVELPSEGTGSVYDLSKRFVTADIGSFLRKGARVIHPTCKLAHYVGTYVREAHLPLHARQILEAKGYSLIGDIWIVNEKKEAGLEPDPYMIVQVIPSTCRENGRAAFVRLAPGERSGKALHRVYDGTLSMHLTVRDESIFGNDPETDPTYSSFKTRVSIYKEGDQYTVDAIENYEELTAKAALAMPACALLSE